MTRPPCGLLGSVFGTVEDERGGDPVQYIDLGGTDGSPVLRYQRAPESKTVKDRIQLDLRVDDIEEECRRVIELGGVRVEQDSSTNTTSCSG